MFKSHPIPIFSIQLSSQYFSSHTAATVTIDATKLGVLGKGLNTRNVVVPLSARSVCVQFPPGPSFCKCIFQYFFFIGDAMLTRNVAVPSPARTVCDQFPPGPRFCKCIFQYFFCIGDAMLCSSDMKLGVLGVNIITHNVVKLSRYSTSACSNSTRFQFFSFSCLVSTFLVILPRQIAVTPPNLEYLASGLIRVMWLHLRPPEQCGFKSHQVPTFSGVGISKYTFFRPNIDLMWLHLRPPEQCGFKSHQVPTFSGVGISKYTFFRPNIDHMPFCYLIDIIDFHTVIGLKHSTAE